MRMNSPSHAAERANRNATGEEHCISIALS